jgi:hypothetical protein
MCHHRARLRSFLLNVAHEDRPFDETPRLRLTVGMMYWLVKGARNGRSDDVTTRVMMAVSRWNSTRLANTGQTKGDAVPSLCQAGLLSFQTCSPSKQIPVYFKGDYLDHF